MSKSVASTVAVALAVLAWPLAFYGVVSQSADYVPSTPQSVIEFNQHVSVTVLFAGLFCVFGAIWFAGYSFSQAKIRALITMSLCILMLMFAAVGMWV